MSRDVFVLDRVSKSFDAGMVHALKNVSILIEEGETGQIFTDPKHQMTQDYITGRFG